MVDIAIEPKYLVLLQTNKNTPLIKPYTIESPRSPYHKTVLITSLYIDRRYTSKKDKKKKRKIILHNIQL